MEDLARIVMVMFVAWIVSGAALAALVFLAPATWSRPFRFTLMGVAASLFVLLTAALFGSRVAVVAVAGAAVAAFVVYHTIRSS